MLRSLFAIALVGACSLKKAPPEVAPVETAASRTLPEATERGLKRADPVPPLRGGYEAVPSQWSQAAIHIDDQPVHGAVACLYDPYTILAQPSAPGAETIYTVALRHPPVMTTSSEGFVDQADRMRVETEGGVATYEAKFGKDRDDFRAKRVRIEAPADLRPCRP